MNQLFGLNYYPSSVLCISTGVCMCMGWILLFGWMLTKMLGQKMWEKKWYADPAMLIIASNCSHLFIINIIIINQIYKSIPSQNMPSLFKILKVHPKHHSQSMNPNVQLLLNYIVDKYKFVTRSCAEKGPFLDVKLFCPIGYNIFLTGKLYIYYR